MLVFLNGNFVPEAQAVVSVFDRSFLYGDGLFETIRVCNGKPFRWAQHLERLQRGAEFLKLRPPLSPDALRDFAAQLIERNQMPESLLRLTLSRGVGPRGYSPKGADRPTVVMSLHSAPDIDPKNPPQWRLITSSVRLPANEPLAQFKTCNKLPQILARAEADVAGADEALLLNTNGEVIEAASSNLFWIENDTVCTPPLVSGILPGVTRAVVLEICRKLKIETQETTIFPKGLQQVQSVFLSLSSWGIVQATTLDNHRLSRSPLVEKFREEYHRLVRAETE
ncbi:MAG: aminodeoxychorismate lyase [Verrucomicrobia bacterium]|nr:aminodeoxychorismate lyase [Verrucomicrobiota bacterium]